MEQKAPKSPKSALDPQPLDKPQENCNFCQKDTQNKTVQLRVPQHWPMGWVHCETKACAGYAEEAYKSHVYEAETVIQQTGNPVRIKRSDGKMHEGWQVGMAMQLDGKWWVRVSTPSQELTKVVPLTDLVEWNDLVVVEY